MEWISFNLDTKKKIHFENELLPAVNNQNGFLLEMTGLTWKAYFKRIGLDSYEYIFCSDSPLFIKYIKAFAVDFKKLYALPDTENLDYFGPENINPKVNQ